MAVGSIMSAMCMLLPTLARRTSASLPSRMMLLRMMLILECRWCSHFETVADEVEALYKKSTGEALDLNDLPTDEDME